MTLHYNKISEKEKRRALRNQMPLAEKIVWLSLRKRQICGVRFLRQYSIDHYVLDFYSPEIKLAIEIDGETHSTKEEKEYDMDRQKYVESFGVKVIRFKNEQVFGNVDKVIENIKSEVKTRLTIFPPFNKGETKGGSRRRL